MKTQLSKSTQPEPHSSSLPTSPNFAAKLFYMLNDPANHHAIDWIDTAGTGFRIIDFGHFINRTLSKYYRHSNLASFIRQLNMYGFRKVKHENQDEQYYFYPLFKKNQPEFVKKICRKPQKKIYNQWIQQPGQNEAIPIIQQKPDIKKVIKPKKVRFFQPFSGLKPKQQQTREPSTSKKQSNNHNNHELQSFCSLANILNQCSRRLLPHKQFGDHLSICDQQTLNRNIDANHSNTIHERSTNKSVRGHKNNQSSIKSKVLFWSPSQIITKKSYK